MDSTKLIESRNMLDMDLFTKLFIQIMEPPRNFCGTIQIVQSVSSLEDVKKYVMNYSVVCTVQGAQRFVIRPSDVTDRYY